jgi:hypothetical protein
LIVLRRVQPNGWWFGHVVGQVKQTAIILFCLVVKTLIYCFRMIEEAFFRVRLQRRRIQRLRFQSTQQQQQQQQQLQHLKSIQIMRATTMLYLASNPPIDVHNPEF